MQLSLSTIKASVAGSAHAVADRVQTNWKSLSTPAKVATIGSSVVLVGAGIAAFATHSLLTSAIAGLSAKVVFAVAGGTAGLGLIVPGAALLRKPSEAPKKAEEAPIQKALEEAVGPEASKQEEPVVETAPAPVKEEPVVVAPNSLKNALVVSAIAIACIAFAYHQMGPQGRASLIEDAKKAQGYAVDAKNAVLGLGTLGKELATAFREDVRSGKVREFATDAIRQALTKSPLDVPQTFHLQF